MNPEQLAQLRAELTNDPAGLGYSGKTHEEMELLLNASVRDVDNDRWISTAELFELLDVEEYLALTPSKRPVMTDLLALDQVKPGAANFRKAIEFVFEPNSKTRTNVNKMQKRKGTRWEELGLPKPTTSQIADALR